MEQPPSENSERLGTPQIIEKVADWIDGVEHYSYPSEFIGPDDSVGKHKEAVVAVLRDGSDDEHDYWKITYFSNNNGIASKVLFTKLAVTEEHINGEAISKRPAQMVYVVGGDDDGEVLYSGMPVVGSDKNAVKLLIEEGVLGADGSIDKDAVSLTTLGSNPSMDPSIVRHEEHKLSGYCDCPDTGNNKEQIDAKYQDVKRQLLGLLKDAMDDNMLVELRGGAMQEITLQNIHKQAKAPGLLKVKFYYAGGYLRTIAVTASNGVGWDRVSLKLQKDRVMPFAHGNNDALIDVLLPELADGKYSIMSVGDNGGASTRKAENGPGQDGAYGTGQEPLVGDVLGEYLVGMTVTAAWGAFKDWRLEGLRGELRWLDNMLCNNIVHESMVGSYEQRVRGLMNKIMRLDGGD